LEDREVTKITALMLPRSDKIWIYIDVYPEDRLGKCKAAAKIEFVERDAFEMDEAPLISLSRTEAQALVDSLWSCGIRPADGQGRIDRLKAEVKELREKSNFSASWIRVLEEEKQQLQVENKFLKDAQIAERGEVGTDEDVIEFLGDDRFYHTKEEKRALDIINQLQAQRRPSEQENENVEKN
jgi:hypothetical protein